MMVNYHRPWTPQFKGCLIKALVTYKLLVFEIWYQSMLLRIDDDDDKYDKIKKRLLIGFIPVVFKTVT